MYGGQCVRHGQYTGIECPYCAKERAENYKEDSSVVSVPIHTAADGLPDLARAKTELGEIMGTISTDAEKDRDDRVASWVRRIVAAAMNGGADDQEDILTIAKEIVDIENNNLRMKSVMNAVYNLKRRGSQNKPGDPTYSGQIVSKESLSNLDRAVEDYCTADVSMTEKILQTKTCRSLPIFWNHDSSRLVGIYDKATDEIDFVDDVLTSKLNEGNGLGTAIRVIESEEVDGVTVIKKAKLMSLSIISH